MAYRNQSDDSPACLIELMDFIEENTGLLGDENPGDARFAIGGNVVMVTSDRPSFDKHSQILKKINESYELKINHIGLKRSYKFDRPHPSLEVTTK